MTTWDGGWAGLRERSLGNGEEEVVRLTKGRLIGCLLVGISLVWLGPDVEAGIPSLSGISQATRGLAKWLQGGSRFDAKGVGQLLSVLNDSGITEEVRDATIKRSLKALAGDAKTAGEHLSQLELLMDELERALKTAKADLEMATGPSLDDLADERSRCQTIEQLRTANRSFGEAVETVRNQPAVLSAVEQRAKTLHKFLVDWTRALEDMLADPVLAGFLYDQIGNAWISADFDKGRAYSMQNRVARVKKSFSSLPSELEQKRDNFNANMKSLIEPLARDSCDQSSEFDDEPEDELERDPLAGLESEVDSDLDDIAAETGSKAARQVAALESWLGFDSQALMRALQSYTNDVSAAQTAYADRLRAELTASIQQMTAQIQAMRSAGSYGGGTDARCGKARAQVREYDQALGKLRRQGYPTGYHRKVNSLYLEGRRQNQAWINRNC